MLLELRIRDFAIIDALDLRLEPGLTVLTGETGAGKSIIVDAVEVVLGEWADSTVIRAGAERSLIEAVFRLDQDERARVNEVLEEEGLEGDDERLLLLGREVRLNKRNICRVNGRTVTLSLLREVTEGLVDIHGQSEHLSLLRVSEHRGLLDRFAELEALREEVSDTVQRVEAVRSELEELRVDERELAHRTDLLAFQIDEIASAGLEPGEDDLLRQERPRLANAERLAELTREVTAVLEEGERQHPSATDLLGTALRSLAEAARLDPSLAPVLEDAEAIELELDELARQLRDYQRDIEYSPQRLREVEERLSLIHRLERKYGETVEDVRAYGENARRELDKIQHSDQRIDELEKEEQALLEGLSARARTLSEQRRVAAQELARRVEQELADLQMVGARFGVLVGWRPAADGVPLPSSVTNLAFEVSSSGIEEKDGLEGKEVPHVAFDGSGIDRIEFLMSPNRGEPLKPMTRIASGGETSRLMLALKTVLSQVDETRTLVFDEIDQGIGGRVGATVGEKLWSVATAVDSGSFRHQVLCVTHLPQLAGFGDCHLRVEKYVKDIDGQRRTVARVRSLERQERVEELAQMLGGTGEAARRSAEELLSELAKRKERGRPGRQADRYQRITREES